MKQNRKTQTPDGVYDYLPPDAAIHNQLKKNLMKEFETWGYNCAETPVLEYYDLYNSAEINADEEMFKLVDGKGCLLALRPDITTSIARMAAVKMSAEELPLRLSYAGDVFRFGVKEIKQMTQRSQIGIELLGDNTVSADAEAIALAITALRRVGLKNFQIEIGQVSFFKGLMKEAGLDSDTAKAVRELVEQKNMLGIEMLLQDMPGNKALHQIIAELPYLYGGAEILEYAGTLTNQSQCAQAIEKLKSVYHTLCAFGLAEYVTFDLGMVQSLDYYTGIIFRGISFGMGAPILNGGRYDGLMEKFGVPMPAVGFAIELSGLCEAAEIAGIQFDELAGICMLGYIHGNESFAFEQAAILRANGERVILHPCENAADLMVYAKKRNALKVLLANDGAIERLG